ncbi:hypothetical protein DPMN_155344 [Dreissena polymorpha]|uniref:Uncharacterized protein n=1 Tax=Dreissena polymorpha TaxID=45954 RepID=A0A9D4FMT6_DREPO|nr:hypothetical protein DPMN_155344 [Dreissena polymorpha]
MGHTPGSSATQVRHTPGSSTTQMGHTPGSSTTQMGHTPGSIKPIISESSTDILRPCTGNDT